MSVEEIEKAIEELSPEEQAQVAEWFRQRRIKATGRVINGSNGSERSLPAPGASLADRLGNLIGSVGHEQADVSSSRDAGEQFTNYLSEKKSRGTL